MTYPEISNIVKLLSLLAAGRDARNGINLDALIEFVEASFL